MNPFDFDYVTKAEWKLNPDPPRLPAQIYFQHPGTIKIWRQQYYALSQPPTLRPLLPPFGKGYTQAAYLATDFRKTGALSLPAHCEYNAFAAELVAGTAPVTGGRNLFLTQHYEVRLDKLDVLPKGFDSVPTPPSGPFRVIDLRFARRRPPIVMLTYSASGSWPSEEDVRQTEEFKEQAQTVASLVLAAAAHSNHSDTFHVNNLTAIGIMVLIAIAFLVALRSITKRPERCRHT